MTETVTQFVSRVLGLVAEPPAPKRGMQQWATGPRCWLCGGDTGGRGWPQSVAIAPTFTQHNTARCGDSDTVCMGCAALTRGELFQTMVKDRGLPIKLWTQCGWHCYSHHVREDGHYSSPSRDEMRTIIMTPPAGRWVLSINPSGVKHTIFRGAVATSPVHFPVQMDETTVWCRRADVDECMAAFEALCALGFSKDSILSGSYHSAQMMKAGLSRWQPAEERLAPWRGANPDLLALVHYVARGPKYFEPVEDHAPTPAATPAPKTMNEQTAKAPPPASAKGGATGPVLMTAEIMVFVDPLTGSRHVLHHAPAPGAVTAETLVFDPEWNDVPEIAVSARHVLAFCDAQFAGDTCRRFGPPDWVFVWDCVSSFLVRGAPIKRMKMCLYYGPLAGYDHNVARNERRIVKNPRGIRLHDVYQEPISAVYAAGGRHPKPLTWVRMLIGNRCSGVVTDPFAGTGTSMIAAADVGRNSESWETDPAQIEVIRARAMKRGLVEERGS